MAKFHDAADLQQQVQQHFPNWLQLCSLAQSSKSLASPSVLIISASAPRANDLAKLLPDISKVHPDHIGPGIPEHYQSVDRAIKCIPKLYGTTGCCPGFVVTCIQYDLHMGGRKTAALVEQLLPVCLVTILGCGAWPLQKEGHWPQTR